MKRITALVALICLQPLLWAVGTEQDIFQEAKGLLGESRYVEAIEAYEKAFDQLENENIMVSADDLRNAKTSYGSAHWAIGEYKKGFEQFDARLEESGKPRLTHPLTPQVIAEGLKNVTILVRCEYGLGDTFGFLKFAKALVDAGASIILLAQNPLKSLLSRSNECAEHVVNAQDRLPAYDYDVYLMSLPRFVSKQGLRPMESHKDIPHFGAYIHPQEKRVSKWFQFIKKFGKRPICICWAASKNPVPGGRLLDRDIPLAVLSKLGTMPDVQLYSVQGDRRSPITQQEWETLSPEEQHRRSGDIVSNDVASSIHCFDNSFDQEPFEDTAALLKATELESGYLVSVDTSIPNLTGAMNMPTCMLMHYNPDARWGERTPGAVAKDNRFHQSVKEFWQPEPGKWEPVVDSVIEYISHH